MAALTQSTNEPVPISNPLSGTPSSLISSPPDSIAFLRQSKQDSSLSSIASAGLHVSRSRESLPPMATTAPATGPMDRPHESDKDSEQISSQVAREALGASEKQQGVPIHDPMHMSSDQMQVDSHPAAVNVSDAFGVGDTNATLMNTSTVASPGPIEDSASQDGDRPRHRDEEDLRENSNKAFSYPMPTGALGDPRRGLSLPNSGFHKSGQRSPSAKKHRCPYCATEFTRHHNLKSHLLTHSQEKPYVCQTCQSRFRRLHDLKRHTKLHTGERPHICSKCGRRFARGDALARHNKGQGGCAGRRASMGSYAPEDDYGEGAVPTGAEDTMDGLVFAEPERMDEEDERRLNMPSIKKHDAPAESIPRSNTTNSYQPRQPSTYPPIAAGRPSPGGLFPPPTSHGGSSASTSPISQTGNMTFPPSGQPSGASVFQTTNVTESPKPLSPHNAPLPSHQLGHGPDSHVHLHRAHSPGMTQSFQQQPFGRAGPSQGSLTGHGVPGLGLPPPQPGAPQLPPPPGMSASDGRFSLHAQGSVQSASSTAPKHSSSHSHSSNHSGPLSSKIGLDATPGNGNLLPGPPHDPSFAEQTRDREDKLWAYIRSVHEELTGLKSEVTALRAQLASSNANGLASPVPNATSTQADTNAGTTTQR
ncbi:C2H2 zinc finger protein [Aspergillus clavatus NRRL 1]|uniref:C2H2 zinc finger protein n=1 Tax=Aspergillus clavatus (strain ATCC 1007 / CBS 513.65 / DSM 816 / NCTC 3887 / NRRL 1 / QM 1276 / 107) TaxID=344612 RepID=A1CD78_ASPCL|nr:C2H2 zinc finger protein [Aspergillus clavatus NRRL 1]EAW11805.1 C2H2 zinc finger protein [Aspergillus clavatus NRRL 1]